MKITKRWFLVALLLAVLIVYNGAVNGQQVKPINLTISVAASLKNTMKDIALAYSKQTPNVKLVYNSGSSGSLQQQIEQGAPVDVFISASPKQMNALQAKDLLLVKTRKNILKNQIVLIVPKNSKGISGFKDLTGKQVEKIAIGNPESVPAGQYGKETLTFLNLYQQIADKLVFAQDVRQVLSYVETGNVDGGIVYITDAKTSNQVRIVAIAPEKSHSPILYIAAVIKDSQNPAAATAFVDFLSSNGAKAIFKQYGFTPL